MHARYEAIESAIAAHRLVNAGGEAAIERRKEKEEHSVEAYESKFKEIEQITGETDLDKLVDRFIQVENKNYALFNFVNELNNQVEFLQDQIDQVKWLFCRYY